MAAESKGRAMTQWSVAVTVGRSEHARAVDDDVAAIAESLAGFAPVIAAGPDSVTVRLALESKTAEEGIVRVVAEVKAALEAVEWPSEVRHVEATEWSELERKLGEPTYPQLVGISEIADLLETSRQRASELARSSRFPAPLADLAAGPVWPKPVVTRFIKEWERKPGRPRSKAT